MRVETAVVVPSGNCVRLERSRECDWFLCRRRLSYVTSQMSLEVLNGEHSGLFTDTYTSLWKYDYIL